MLLWLKELITNVIKHSKADEISINVSYDKIISILIEIMEKALIIKNLGMAWLYYK